MFPEKVVAPERVNVPVLGKTGVLPDMQSGSARAVHPTFRLKVITTEVLRCTHFALSVNPPALVVVIVNGSLVTPLPLYGNVPVLKQIMCVDADQSKLKE
jgi:hypothetical protein